MDDLLKITTDNLQKAQQHQAKYADKKHRDIIYTIGDKVLLSSTNLKIQSQVNHPSNKFNSKYIGPFEITEQVSASAYHLKLPKTMRIHPVFHMSLLKTWNQSPPYPGRIPKPSAPVIIEDQIEYEVEKILDKRIHYYYLEYLIK
jgi:hypothetical protein